MSSPEFFPESYLIGGGAHLGRHVANLLAQRGETKIAVLDSRPPRPQEECPLPSSVQILVGDITDPNVVNTILKTVRTRTWSYSITLFMEL